MTPHVAGSMANSSFTFDPLPIRGIGIIDNRRVIPKVYTTSRHSLPNRIDRRQLNGGCSKKLPLANELFLRGKGRHNARRSHIVTRCGCRYCRELVRCRIASARSRGSTTITAANRLDRAMSIPVFYNTDSATVARSTAGSRSARATSMATSTTMSVGSAFTSKGRLTLSFISCPNIRA